MKYLYILTTFLFAISCSPSNKLDDSNQKRAILNGLLEKYFGQMESGKDYRPITDSELKQTSVYRIIINHWSGKDNWPEKAEQAENNEWPDLESKWFDIY